MVNVLSAKGRNGWGAVIDSGLVRHLSAGGTTREGLKCACAAPPRVRPCVNAKKRKLRWVESLAQGY